MGPFKSRFPHANKLFEVKIAENIDYANNIQLKGSKAFESPLIRSHKGERAIGHCRNSAPNEAVAFAPVPKRSRIMAEEALCVCFRSGEPTASLCARFTEG
jgi:hypothetical protein